MVGINNIQKIRLKNSGGGRLGKFENDYQWPFPTNPFLTCKDLSRGTFQVALKLRGYSFNRNPLTVSTLGNIHTKNYWLEV